jgi:UDP-glucuronate 4-epimerase
VARNAELCKGDFIFIEGDIRNTQVLTAALAEYKPTAIVHLASRPGVGASVADPWLCYDVNLTGTLNLLEAARQHGRPNFVFASTSSAYGRTQQIPFVETDAADRPLAPYPASKRAAELLGHTYHHLHGLDFCALRFFTVYGPRGRPDMLPLRVLDHLFRAGKLAIYQGGELQRDWTYVGDIVAGILAAVDTRVGYEIVNLGRGQPVSVSGFVETVERLAAKKVSASSAAMPDADMPVTYANVEKARKLFGYQPETSVSEGVTRMLAWYRESVLSG